jgi:alpha/beta hydrolase family protein
MLNPLDFRPYVRALVVGTARWIGVAGFRDVPRLPPSTLFTLGTSGIPAHPFFNPLPGVTLRVPQLDAAEQPMGGVRFPEVDLPIGVASPVAIPHVGTTAITDVCGNFGGWVPRTKADLDAQYGDESAYVALYAQKVDALIAAGFVLAEDKPGMLATAAALYPDS